VSANFQLIEWVQGYQHLAEGDAVAGGDSHLAHDCSKRGSQVRTLHSQPCLRQLRLVAVGSCLEDTQLSWITVDVELARGEL
jgi:hypothetical protein